MDFLKLLVYRLSAYIMDVEVDKSRFILGAAHSLVGRDPRGSRTHLFTQHLSAPYSGVRPSMQRRNIGKFHHVRLGVGGKEARNNHLPIVGNSASWEGS